MSSHWASRLRLPSLSVSNTFLTAKLSPGYLVRSRSLSTKRQHPDVSRPQIFSRHTNAGLSVRLHGTRANSTSHGLKNPEAEPSPPISRGQSIRRGAYRNAQTNGFQGTMVEWGIECGKKYRKYPEEPTCITTLRLEEALSHNQYLIPKPGNQAAGTNLWRGHVIFNGESLGVIHIFRGPHSPLPMDGHFCLYMLPGSYILRLRKRDGSDHTYRIDVRDFMHKTWCRTLADLAARQGLIEPIESDGCIRSFNFEANVKAQYRISLKPSRRVFYGLLRYTPQSTVQRLNLRIDPEDLPDTSSRIIRGFFHIDRDGMMRFWDVDRQRDISWRATQEKGRFSTTWNAEVIRRRYPDLWAHAVRLGHWRAD